MLPPILFLLTQRRFYNAEGLKELLRYRVQLFCAFRFLCCFLKLNKCVSNVIFIALPYVAPQCQHCFQMSIHPKDVLSLKFRHSLQILRNSKKHRLIELYLYFCNASINWKCQLFFLNFEFFQSSIYGFPLFCHFAQLSVDPICLLLTIIQKKVYCSDILQETLLTQGSSRIPDLFPGTQYFL